MTLDKNHIEKISIRLAETDQEVEAAQRLRYKVFYEEHGAQPIANMAEEKRDYDDFDTYANHLIVVDNINGDEKVVGTYRLLLQNKAEEYGRFYTSSEFNIDSLLDSGASLLELGRSCVLPEYRIRPVMQLLWQGIADFIVTNNVELMFGCASLHGTDVESLAPQLSYLYHNHLSPEQLRPKAKDDLYVDMNIIPESKLDKKKALSMLPPLIKGYLRVGATIGDGAVIDKQFNTTDVCIIVQTHQVTSRYRDHYARKIQRDIPSDIPEYARDFPENQD